MLIRAELQAEENFGKDAAKSGGQVEGKGGRIKNKKATKAHYEAQNTRFNNQ